MTTPLLYTTKNINVSVFRLKSSKYMKQAQFHCNFFQKDINLIFIILLKLKIELSTFLKWQ